MSGSSKAGAPILRQLTDRQQIYRQLHPWQSRLVKLLPDEFKRPLRCELTTADITFQEGLGIPDESRLQTYEALSYCWGEQTNLVPIDCNNARLEITPSLSEALRHLRSTSEPRWLWIDALCINQKDNMEKSNQVQLMLIIYAKALRVIAWLGLPDSDDCSGSESSMVVTPTALGDRQYFRRTWVVQEIFAAQDLIFQCGIYQIDASVFDGIEAARPLLQNRGAINFKQLFTTKCTKAAPRPNTWQVEQFFTLLAQGRDREVSDPRDSLYAVLGMMNNQLDNAFADLAIDYQKSELELSADLFKYTIRITDTYECVADAIMRLPVQPLPPWHLPSWLCSLRQYADIAHYRKNELLRHFANTPRHRIRTRYPYEDSGSPLVSSGDASDLPDLSSDYRTLVFRGRVHPHAEQRLDWRYYISPQHPGNFVKLDESMSLHEPVSICGTSRLRPIGYLLIVRTGLQDGDSVVASHRSEEMLVLRRVQTSEAGSETFSAVGVAYAVIHHLAHRSGSRFRNKWRSAVGLDLQDLFGIPACSNSLIHPKNVDEIYDEEFGEGEPQSAPTFSGEEQDFVLV